MTRHYLAAPAVLLLLSACAQTSISKPSEGSASLGKYAAAPALGEYTKSLVFDDLWKRSGLSPRDRSVVTLAALISRGDSSEQSFHFRRALENGVKPAEISEIITHLAFYSGWGNSTTAVAIATDVFSAQGISSAQLPAKDGPRLPFAEDTETPRLEGVAKNFNPASPGVVHYTTEVLFKDLWLRPDLAPRDRSLVTVASLVATGQVAQIPFHLNRAMDNGLTETEVQETLTQLAFYAGWPHVFSAMPVVKEVLAKRPG